MVISFLDALWHLSVAMAPYILFGLLMAGLLHLFLPDAFIAKHMGKKDLASIIKATVFGIPLPVCSCGVIPLATQLRKEGASKGATLSFLIATPISGIDSIVATYGLFGLFFTIYRIVASLIIALAAGVLMLFSEKRESSRHKSSFGLTPQGSATVLQSNRKSDTSCCSSESCCDSGTSKKHSRIYELLHYAFVALLGDIAKPLLWGLLIGAAITVAVPEELSSLLSGSIILSYLIAIAIAVPMYVCATASLPIAAALILQGVSAGAAFTFLMAGPATNTVTIGVVKKLLGIKAVIIYLSVIVIGSILFGLGLDYLFEKEQINPTSIVHLEGEHTLFGTLSSIVMWGLLVWLSTKEYTKRLFSPWWANRS